MSPDVRLAESANAFAQHHDGWEDAARADAHFSEPLFIAGLALLAIIGVVLRRPRVLSASVLAVRDIASLPNVGLLVTGCDRGRRIDL